MPTLIFLPLFLLSMSANANDKLWAQLKNEPYMVVMVRNAESSGNVDGANMLAWDASGNCAGESILTEAGKIQAQLLGKAFSTRGIKPVVISSPMCRCKQTAQIAFGDHLVDANLRQRAVDDSASQEKFLQTANTLLASQRGKSPVVFINHRPNIDALTMELIGLGELLVGRLSEDGEIETIGIIRIEQQNDMPERR